MWTQQFQPDLTSAEQAADLGYESGKALRDHGAEPHALQFNVEVHRGNYPRSLFYSEWLDGFTRGFLGRLKPSR